MVYFKTLTIGGDIISIIIAILVFGLLIFTHELGHFLAAKWVGVDVIEFSMGMGPLLWHKDWKGTQYSIRLLPIGGFCQMEGENGDEEPEANDQPKRSVHVEGSFAAKPIWARFLVLFCGPLMNLLTGFLILLIMYNSNTAATTTIVDQFKEGETPTQQAGLMAGDEILRIDGQRIHTADNILAYLQWYDGEPVEMQISRNGEKMVLHDITFPYSEVDKAEATGNPKDEGTMLRVYRTDFYVERTDNNFFQSLHDAWFKSIDVAKLIWTSFVQLVTGRVPVSDLSGPVGVTDAISTAAQNGLWSLGNIVVLIAINLGVLNLLPLPALDGGRIVFLLVEAIIRRPVPAKYEGFVHFAGLVLLMGFSLLITFQDVWKLLVR